MLSEDEDAPTMVRAELLHFRLIIYGVARCTLVSLFVARRNKDINQCEECWQRNVAKLDLEANPMIWLPRECRTDKKSIPECVCVKKLRVAFDQKAHWQ